MESAPVRARRDWLTAAFPPPEFLTMPAAGLDISDVSVKFVRFKDSTRGYQIDTFGEVPVPEGVVESGKIVDTARFRDVLRVLRKKHGLTFVRASLPEQNSYLFTMKVKPGPHEAVREQIAFKIEEFVPLSAAEAVFDFDFFKEPESNEEVEVSVTAFNRTTVEQYTELLRSESLIPTKLEVEAEAAARAMVPTELKGQHAVIDVGARRTGITIVENDITLFTTTIEKAGEDITRAMMKELSLTRAEAEAMKREETFTPRGNDDFSKVVGPVIEDLVLEIFRKLSYWNLDSEYAENEDEKLRYWLCGGTSMLKGFREYLADSQKLEVEEADVWVNVPRSTAEVPPITHSESFRYAVAIGLALS